ncbi:MAG: GH36-type glycosyl hydrolase domain-containing protein [Armatimonadota bacterium]
MALSKYGHFSDDGREFVITRPDTPAPWVNYISNGRYTGLTTNSGGGYSFYICPKDSRITRHRYNCLPWDRPGRYVYLAEGDEYWSLTWQPVGKEPDFYECRHGMGYTSIETEYSGIRSRVIYFVPQEDDCEVWRVSLENRTDRARELSVTSYVELCLGHALVDLINQPNDQHFNVVRFEDEIIYATKNYWVTYSGATVKQPNQGWNKHVYFATSLPVTAFDGKKDAFIGPWRSESNPVGVERGCGNTQITAGDACAALQSKLTLAPGETKEFTVVMGVADSPTRAVADKYRDLPTTNAALADVKTWWAAYLSSSSVETPDPEMNLMLNTWAKRQAWVTFNMHRTAGHYHGGLLFGTGIRDQCQDLAGPVMSQPDVVAERICEVLSHQFAEGSTLHNFFRLTGHGERTGHSDTPLWLPLAVTIYLKETGDFDFLARVVPYQDEGEGTVLEHIKRAVDYPLSHLSPRNLPLFGPGDWNDTLDYVGRKGIGESIWVAEFLCYVLRELIELLERLGLEDEAARYRAQQILVSEALNDLCWDGEWYFRGTRDDGGIIGSSTNEEGRIFLNAQSWAVISGIAPPDRAVNAMDSAYKMLATPRGPKLLGPAYTKVDPGIGLATRCVPGKKENAGIFNHAAAWAVLAECLIGNGNRAYEYYKETMPMNQAHDPDLYRMEPYVYSEYVTSPDHPTFGEASHSWLTGSAVWMLRDGLEYILGLRPTYDGLMLAPCIPAHWDGFRAVRRFRCATYEIAVENPNHVESGVVEVTVDGEPCGHVLPLFDGGTHKVRCVLG